MNQCYLCDKQICDKKFPYLTMHISCSKIFWEYIRKVNKKDPTFVERIDLKDNKTYRYAINRLKLSCNYCVISLEDIN